MSNIQYIGARYVIKVYENSQNTNSAEWEANTSYEPLTMVTYNNSSYISKKDVPATVGNPAQNASYWAVTGAYNGQISNLQNQVAALQTQIQTLLNLINATNVSDRKFVFQTDSYITMVDELITLMNITDYLTISSSGGGFCQVGVDGHTFITDLQVENADTSVTDVIVIGGQNDAFGGQYPSDVYAAMNAYFALVKSKYPNASIKFIPCQHISDTYGHAWAYLDLQDTFRKACAKNGVKFYENAPYIADSSTYISGDYEHLTSDGRALVIDYILNAINGGDINVERFFKLTPTTSVINGISEMSITHNNSIMEMQFGLGSNGVVTFVNSTTYGSIRTVKTEIASVSGLGGNLTSGYVGQTTVPCIIRTTNANMFMNNCKFAIENGKIYMTLATGMTGISYDSETIQYIEFPNPIKISAPTYFMI